MASIRWLASHCARRRENKKKIVVDVNFVHGFGSYLYVCELLLLYECSNTYCLCVMMTMIIEKRLKTRKEKFQCFLSFVALRRAERRYPFIFILSIFFSFLLVRTTESHRAHPHTYTKNVYYLLSS